MPSLLLSRSVIEAIPVLILECDHHPLTEVPICLVLPPAPVGAWFNLHNVARWHFKPWEPSQINLQKTSGEKWTDHSTRAQPFQPLWDGGAKPSPMNRPNLPSSLPWKFAQHCANANGRHAAVLALAVPRSPGISNTPQRQFHNASS